jgi:aldose 1-epimerase
MFSKLAALAALLPATAFAASIAGNGSAVLPNGKYEISSEGIRANFIPYGASISNLFIKDAHGIERDIVLGWDNATYYTEDKLHPHFGQVSSSVNPGQWLTGFQRCPRTLRQPHQELDLRD